MGTQLTWTEPQSDSTILHYNIYRKTGEVEPDDFTSEDLLTMVDGDLLVYEDFTYTKTALETTGYSYLVRAVNNRGVGDRSNVLYVTYDFMGQ